MPLNSSFTRRDTPKGAEFEVRPAWPSLGGFIFLGIFSAVLLTVGLNLPGMLYVVGPIVGLAWLPLLFDMFRRKPVTILANDEELRVGGVGYSVGDIAELVVKSKNRDESGSPYLVYGSGAYASGANLGHAMNQNSYSLMLRKRSNSRPIKLVYGLQHDTAHALMGDLLGAMR